MQHKFREVVTEKEHMLSDKLEALFRYRFLLSACCLKWRNDTAFVCERFIGTSKQREARSWDASRRSENVTLNENQFLEDVKFSQILFVLQVIYLRKANHDLRLMFDFC